MSLNRSTIQVKEKTKCNNTGEKRSRYFEEVPKNKQEKKELAFC